MKRGTNADPTPSSALGSPVGGSLVPRIYSLPHLSSAGQSGRPDYPHVASPGAIPQATTHERASLTLIFIKQRGSKRSVGKKRGVPNLLQAFFQCLTVPLRLSKPRSHMLCTSFFCVPLLPFSCSTWCALWTRRLGPPRLPSRRASRLATWRGGEGLNKEEKRVETRIRLLPILLFFNSLRGMENVDKSGPSPA